MGTNYYIREEECPLCGCSQVKDTHLCKMSCGWKPLFKRNFALDSVEEYKKYLEVTCISNRIVDEYGDTMDAEAFWQVVRIWNDKEGHKAPIISEYSDKEGYHFSSEEFS